MTYTWPDSAPVPVLERPVREKRERSATPPELSRLKSALDSIPNSGKDELDYDSWWRIVAAIDAATDHSEEGYELAAEFSERSSKHQEDFFRDRVWECLRADREGASITEQTLFNYAASKHGWSDPDMISGFTVSEEAAAAAKAPPAAKKGYVFVQAGEFSRGKPPSWLIKGVVPKADLGVIYGASGSGKSFFALDLACAVATGEEWRGKRVEKARVAYIAAEGAAGFRNRLKALCEQRKLDIDSLDIFVLAGTPNFSDPKQIIELVQAMRANGPFGLVFVDTLAQVSAGSDENSGEDMSKILEHCRVVRTHTGAMVLLIHHSGKDEQRGARGWSGIKGALDVEISILRAEENRMAKVSKMKDGEEGEKFGFKLRPVTLGVDEQGENITSCTIEYTAALTSKQLKPSAEGTREQTVLQIVIDLIGISEGAVNLKDVIDEYVNRTPRDPASTTRDTRRQGAQQAVRTLVGRGVLHALGDAISIADGE